MGLVDTNYVFNEAHRTVAEVAFTADAGTPMTGLFISANGWAGSAPVPFSTGVSTLPVGAAIIVHHIANIINDPNPKNFELVACLTTFIGGPIYLDGSPFSLTFDQSNGQQGWFRP
jgi:hypothetical protein